MACSCTSSVVPGLRHVGHQSALFGSLDQAHQDRVPLALVVRGIVMESDVVSRPRVVVQRAGMGIVFRAEEQLFVDDVA